MTINITVNDLAIFVLAVFVGFEIIAKVPPTLHTPLMSGSNAISGITLVGALVLADEAKSNFDTLAILSFFAVVLATINVVGGFLVTDRMLGMFKREAPAPKAGGGAPGADKEAKTS